MKKSLTLAMVVLVLLSFLVNCGKKNQKERVVIEWLRWPGQVYWEQCIKDLVKEFEEKHPGIKVKISTCPSKDYQRKALTLQAAGLCPDIIFSNRESGMFPLFIEKDILLDLKPFVKKDKEFNLEDFLPCGMDAFTENGRLYAIVVDLNPVLLYYNKDLFDKEGLSYPDKNWDKKKFLEAAKRLTKDENNDGRIDQYGFLKPSFIDWLMRADIPLFNEDNTKVALNNKEAKDLIQYIVDLRLRHKVTPSPGELEFGAYELFATGKLAMMEGIFAFSEKFVQNKNLNWDIAYPLVLSKKYYTSLPITGYSIAKSTKHPEECWEFVKFMTSPYVERVMREKLNTIPPRFSLIKDPKLFSPPPGNISIIPELLEKVVFHPSSVRYPQFGEMAGRKFEEAFLGLKSVKQALDEMEKEGNKILQGK